jgi:hypothetical protein
MTHKNFLHTIHHSGITSTAPRNGSAEVVEIGMLDQRRLRELLDYNPQTGAFTWREEAGGRLDGKPAGTVKNGHLHVTVDGKVYMGGRLAWLHTYGEWPTTLLRYNDGNSKNLAIDNLRLSVPNAERLKDKDARRAYKQSLRTQPLTQELLKKLLNYDPKTGIFTWRESGSGRTQGHPAGTVWQHSGYRMIRINGQDHQAARLAWLYMHGELPEGGRIKFEDEDQTNLRIANLRLARTRQEHNARWRERHPEANREFMYKKNYQGMTIAAYEQMLAAQGGVCAICKRPERHTDNTGTGRLRNLNVDHDHTTNEVRGLLCSACNQAIGLLEDNLDYVMNAGIYLEAYMKKKAAA